MAVQIASLALGLLVMHSFTRSTIDADARRAAEVARDDLLDEFRAGRFPALIAAVSQRVDSVDDRNLIVMVRRPDGTKLAGNLSHWPAGLGTRERWRTLNQVRDGGQPAPQVGVTTTSLPGGFALLTGEVMENEERLTRASEQSFLWAFLLGLAFTAAIAVFIARVLERRIDAFSAVAAEIALGHLSARVEQNNRGDAFDRLGVAINIMLARIESLVRELRLLTDSMAHDLRSPVSRLRSVIERALTVTRDPTAQSALGQSLEEASNLHRMLDMALQISRTEAGMGRDQFVSLALDEAVQDVAEVYGPIAEDAGFAVLVDVPPNLQVTAHRDLLLQALTNLIENALKHATGGSRIVVGASRSAEMVRMWVADDGPGIPPERLGEALRRFGRLDPARTEGGAGLGLSLVETIAHLHGGSMRVERSSEGGLTVSLAMPIAAAA